MSGSSQTRRIVVVGGGISGLAAANRLLELNANCDQKVEVTLVEATNRCGGLFGTERIGDYVVETGADSFITNKPAAVNLCERLGLADELISVDEQFRRSFILQNGRPIPTPAGFNLLAPGEWWPLITTPLLSLFGKLRVASELFVPRSKSNEDESLAAFVRRRFGNEVLENIVQPLVGGIYTSDPEKLSLKATLPRFVHMERTHGSLIRALRSQPKEQSGEKVSGVRYGLFATLREGMGQLTETLQKRVESLGLLRKSTQIQSISQKSDDQGTAKYRLKCEDGEIIEADGVVLAISAYRMADLIADLQPELAEKLREIEYASSAIVVSGHKLSDIEHPMDAFGLVIPHKERRRILAVSFLSRKFPTRAPEGSIILRTFVGGAMQPEELQHSDAEIAATVAQELKSIFGVKGTPDFVKTVRYNRAMPQYHVGHLDRVKRIEALADGLTGIEFAGNACHGVGVPDSIQSGESASEKLWESLFSAPEMGTPVA
ncbi:MAG: protoporphyrinogen oxidase [Planctomycetaceae bacterium]|nr:protoporphyrinogen oxidase [Planctomycetaceae bacterium]MCB9950161.1 protoporphyrinogen oxidase [Planctomycetaceae bacterium]